MKVRMNESVTVDEFKYLGSSIQSNGHKRGEESVQAEIGGVSGDRCQG